MGIKRALKINFHLTFSFQQQKKTTTKPSAVHFEKIFKNIQVKW